MGKYLTVLIPIAPAQIFFSVHISSRVSKPLFSSEKKILPRLIFPLCAAATSSNSAPISLLYSVPTASSALRCLALVARPCSMPSAPPCSTPWRLPVPGRPFGRAPHGARISLLPARRLSSSSCLAAIFHGRCALAACSNRRAPSSLCPSPWRALPAQLPRCSLSAPCPWPRPAPCSSHSPGLELLPARAKLSAHRRFSLLPDPLSASCFFPGRPWRQLWSSLPPRRSPLCHCQAAGRAPLPSACWSPIASSRSRRISASVLRPWIRLCVSSQVGLHFKPRPRRARRTPAKA